MFEYDCHLFSKWTDVQLKSATGAISINGLRLKKEHYGYCISNKQS